jgi:serine phosphatase RsbU (regulator of sigma subunit)
MGIKNINISNMMTTTDNIELQRSLESAKIVQIGLLPKKRHLQRVLKEYFVIYKPKDIVSGDFYWVGAKHGLKYLVVGDCTGHGISASLLSVLGLNLFEYVIMNKGIKRVSKILQEVDKKFIESFSKEGNPFDNPWIDLSIICIDKENKKVHFSSANRKLFVVDNNKNVQLFRGSRYPIGGWQIEDNRSFVSSIIPYEKGTMLYLGSDGFQDQIGERNNKKFKSKNLHRLLSEISCHTVSDQEYLLNHEFEDWKGNSTQTDDVCLIGVRL